MPGETGNDQEHRMYSDNDVAELYNLLNPWGTSDDFYLSLAVSAPSVLDVGCGTGRLLHRTRDAGHTGHLVGVDPDRDVLDIAKRRSDIEWIESAAAAMTLDPSSFDLAIMMNHAFQCLITDTELVASLARIRQALKDSGRFAFETRNPECREWESWSTRDRDNPIAVVDHRGQALQISYQILAVEGDIVTLTETTADANGTVLRVDEGKLRFLDRNRLSDVLIDAGFSVEQQYGDWHGGPLKEDSAEFVTIARA